MTFIVDGDCVYLCGNSLGLQSKRSESYVKLQLEKWQTEGVLGHFSGDFQWLTIDDIVRKGLADIVGAKEIEVGVMNTLTTNLHLMMVSFYRPTKDRYKILIEKSPFPSDLYAVESQARFHGFDPADAIVQIGPKEGHHTIEIEDIKEILSQHEFSLILLPGIQFMTGQFFDMELITKLGKDHGATVGWDLAHATGNVPLKLHDWNVDFAVWCSYKYLNSGAGGIGGFFVHEKHANNFDLPRFAGWWGHDLDTRFKMSDPFSPIPGAYGYRLSNPCIFPVMTLYGTLELIQEVGFQNMRQKSLLLTGYLETLLKSELGDVVTILTPDQPERRGCQLSVLIHGADVKGLEKALYKEGVVCDVRGTIIRASPVPLYNSFTDVRKFINVLKVLLNKN